MGILDSGALLRCVLCLLLFIARRFVFRKRNDGDRREGGGAEARKGKERAKKNTCFVTSSVSSLSLSLERERERLVLLGFTRIVPTP